MLATLTLVLQKIIVSQPILNSWHICVLITSDTDTINILWFRFGKHLILNLFLKISRKKQQKITEIVLWKERETHRASMRVSVETPTSHIYAINLTYILEDPTSNVLIDRINAESWKFNEPNRKRKKMLLKDACNIILIWPRSINILKKKKKMVRYRLKTKNKFILMNVEFHSFIYLFITFRFFLIYYIQFR